uniref:C2H2-type domain-containing protein n=1 Tax=Anopheles maculatus TaxID=74869 RepID=A0A182S5H8_9DIPT
MSGTRNVPFGTDLPPPLVPLPSCHARVKQLQARLFNGLPLTTSYIANCRLCLSSNFGEKSTTIIEEQLCAMLKQITNQIGLPMNVCAECYKAVQMFYGYSLQVLANQQKLQETLIKTEPFEYNEINKAILERVQHPDTHREAVEPRCQELGTEIKREDESQGKNYQGENYEILIDAHIHCKTEVDDTDQGQDPLLQPTLHEPVSLRSVRRVGHSKLLMVKNVEDQVSFIDCKTKANDSESATDTQKVKPPLPDFDGVRKKTRLTSGEACKSTVEPSATVDDAANSSSGPKPVYICSICNQVFDKHHQLISHQKTHLMRECPICKIMIGYGKMTDHIIKVHAAINRDKRRK